MTNLFVPSILVEVEPLGRRRHIKITERRTRIDWAWFIKEMLETRYKSAKKVLLVMDNLNIRGIASLYQNIKQGEYVVLTVTDQGIGIAKEDLDHIFEPFFSKKAMGRSGTGLGMAVVWGTVQDHEGSNNI